MRMKKRESKREKKVSKGFKFLRKMKRKRRPVKNSTNGY